MLQTAPLCRPSYTPLCKYTLNFTWSPPVGGSAELLLFCIHTQVSAWAAVLCALGHTPRGRRELLDRVAILWLTSGGASALFVCFSYFWSLWSRLRSGYLCYVVSTLLIFVYLDSIKLKCWCMYEVFSSRWSSLGWPVNWTVNFQKT